MVNAEERRKPTNMPDTPYRVKPAEVDPDKNPAAAKNFFAGQRAAAANEHFTSTDEEQKQKAKAEETALVEKQNALLEHELVADVSTLRSLTEAELQSVGLINVI